MPKADFGKPEFPIFRGIRYTLSRLDPQNPIALRMRQIQRQYDKAPEELLDRVENFVKQYDRFPAPSIDGSEEKLYWDIKKMLKKLPPEDPVAIALRQLQRRYKL